MVERMERRGFLASLAALGVGPRLGASAHAAPVGSGGGRKRADLKITKVEILQATGKSKRLALYLKLHTNADAFGLYGPIDGEAAMLVDRFFKRGLVGQDPLAGEAYWDKMFRASRHSRGYNRVPVSTRVNNARNQGAELIEPAGEIVRA